MAQEIKENKNFIENWRKKNNDNSKNNDRFRIDWFILGSVNLFYSSVPI